MKRTLPALAIFSLLLWFCHAQENKTSIPTEQTVLNLEQRWEDALTRSDTAALTELYDDTLVYTHSSGKVDAKSSYLEAIKSGATRYESMKRADIKVAIYDRTAVVTCHWEAHIAARGNKVDLNARYLHVYVKQKGVWKLVAHQSTRIAP